MTIDPFSPKEPPRARLPAQFFRRGFTLFEVIVAVVIIALIAVTVQQFVQATLMGIQFSTEREAEDEGLAALFRHVEAQLDSMPARGQGLLLATPHKFNGFSADELQWRCRGGQGTLTDAADGEWNVTLMLFPQKGKPGKYDLGLRRKTINAPQGDTELNWVPLLLDVAAVKFDFFDPRLNAWLDRWNDQNARPLLVRMQLWRTRDSIPDVATFTINASQQQQ
jgi:prepilin-type N-terminal cleavage/methylation domain-containing protein